MSEPTAINRLRDEIAHIIWTGHTRDGTADRIVSLITSYIPADVLVGLLDGTMVAMNLKTCDRWQLGKPPCRALATLAATKQEART